MKILSFLDSYTHIFADICGVLHDHHSKIQGASEVFESAKTPVILISNAHFSHKHVALLLHKKYSIKAGRCFEKIITSGDYALYAQKQGIHPSVRNAQCLVLPYPNKENACFLEEHFGCHITMNIDRADFIISCGAILSPHIEDYTVLHRARDRGLPLICFNQDIMINCNQKKQLRSGVYASYYQHIGGTIFICGKPDPNFYNFACGDMPAETTLFIGDGITTDVPGANAKKSDVLLTLSGCPALFFDDQQTHQQNLLRLERIFNINIDYFTWSVHNRNPVQSLKMG
ncbi:MAG: HAD hydrolase-like protein [Alphaproteobacteria bacterium]|nr:HAD hydrolase-like protein [Alphaproteobacteria bacterium]